MAMKKTEKSEKKTQTQGYKSKINFKAMPNTLLKKLLSEPLDDVDASILAFSITQDFLEGYEIEDTPEGEKAAVIAIDEAITKALLSYP